MLPTVTGEGSPMMDTFSRIDAGMCPSQECDGYLIANGYEEGDLPTPEWILEANSLQGLPTSETVHFATFVYHCNKCRREVWNSEAIKGALSN